MYICIYIINIILLIYIYILLLIFSISHRLFGSKGRSSSAEESGTGTHDGSTASNLSNEGELPEGWREFFDTTTKRPYYVNRYAIFVLINAVYCSYSMC